MSVYKKLRVASFFDVTRWMMAFAILATSVLAPLRNSSAAEQAFVGCPDTGWTEAELIPDYDEHNEPAFSRTQALGNCGYYATADKICADLRKMNLWPNGPMYRRGCSSLDLNIRAYVRDASAKARTIADFLKYADEASEPEEIAPYAGDGVCPELIFPSDVFVSGETLANGGAKNDIKELYEKVAARLRDMQTRVAASPSLASECPECQLIAPTMSDEQWAEVRKLANSTDLQTNDFAVIQKINQLVCGGWRVKTPNGYSLVAIEEGRDPFLMLQNIKRRLWNRETIPLSLDARELDPLIASEALSNRSHIALIVGAINNPTGISQTGQAMSRAGCHYLVKSSWGPLACEAMIRSKEGAASDVMCVPGTGAYFVPEKRLVRMLETGSVGFGRSDPAEAATQRP